MNIIPLASHPRARERAAGECAARVAERFGLAADIRARLIADTRALVRANCSAAWALRIARRTARRAAAHPEIA
ncbi:MAG: hypothetical protein KAY54_08795 [Burkholderiaceae bacterium]|mgnify:FL=1|nr:hypothetical protein [Burkholderiaceae bacterium]